MATGPGVELATTRLFDRVSPDISSVVTVIRHQATSINYYYFMLNKVLSVCIIIMIFIYTYLQFFFSAEDGIACRFSRPLNILLYMYLS